jgi:hypothetical protein
MSTFAAPTVTKRILLPFWLPTKDGAIAASGPVEGSENSTRTAEVEAPTTAIEYAPFVPVVASPTFAPVASMARTVMPPIPMSVAWPFATVVSFAPFELKSW